MESHGRIQSEALDLTGTHLLELRGFGLAYGTTTVLDALDLTIPPRGVLTLMGPGGSGKSSLLRMLAGLSETKPDMLTWGSSRSSPALSRRPPVLLAQNARLAVASVFENIAAGFTQRASMLQLEQRTHAVALLRSAALDELVPQLDAPMFSLPLGLQRMVCIVRSVAPEPSLLLLDEPTASLDEPMRARIVALVALEAQRRAIVHVSHNIRDAIELGGEIALLAGGRIVERASAEDFVARPRSDEARAMLATGSCISSAPRSIAPTTFTPDVAVVPAGFRYIERPRLAGTTRPGLLADVDDDVRGLARLGIHVLVTLEEEPFGAPSLLARYGIRPHHVPIADMKAPDLPTALELCRYVRAEIANGRNVALHCRAGLGRTGSMLAAYLIACGESSVTALERVRSVCSRYVQSEAQVAFLDDFARYVEDTGPFSDRFSAIDDRGDLHE